MKTFAIGVWLAVLVACGGDDAGTPADAGDNVDAGPPCTGAVYDSCADVAGSTDCMDGLSCHEFEMEALFVCVPSCDADNPCPDLNGATVACNMRGLCRPEAANDCSLP